MSDARPAMVGITGKLPAHGDYVRRGGPAELLAAIDGWLDTELSRACAAGAELDMLVERLDGVRMLVTGTWGRASIVVVASEDRVGRRWPLVVGLSGTEIAADTAKRWWATARGLLAGARDGGETVDAILMRLEKILRPPDTTGSMTQDWRHSDLPVVEHDGLPSGERFNALIGNAQPDESDLRSGGHDSSGEV